MNKEELYKLCKDTLVKKCYILQEDNKEMLKTYDDLEEQYKSLMKKTIEQDKRIKQAFKYCEDIINENIDTTDSDYDLGRDFTARDILYILSPKIN